MPRKDPTCPDCLNKGYLSILGRLSGEERKIVPCTCKHGRRFDKMWRAESPPTKRKARPIRPNAPTNHDIAAQVQPDEDNSGTTRVHAHNLTRRKDR